MAGTLQDFLPEHIVRTMDTAPDASQDPTENDPHTPDGFPYDANLTSPRT